VTYLLDTNVLSEGMRQQPDSRVIKWLDAHQEESAISALTLAELARGAEAFGDGKRKNELLRLIRFMQEDFADAILPFDDAAAWEWARYCKRAQDEGHTVTVMDSLIAATALAYGLTVITRNVADFPGLNVIDPFTAS
jgi:predicted nucleic acid-binding protein